MRFLIVYTSRHGHTATIAQRLADTLEADGAEVLVRRVADAPSCEDFDGVIAGGSVHMERHDSELRDWIVRNRAALEHRPTGFFSVSLTAAGNPGRAREYLDAFLEDADWTPSRTAVFGGALQYRAYNLLTRHMIRQIAHSKGMSTDTRRDTEYTDWAAVDRFARQVAATHPLLSR